MSHLNQCECGNDIGRLKTVFSALKLLIQYQHAKKHDQTFSITNASANNVDNYKEILDALKLTNPCCRAHIYTERLLRDMKHFYDRNDS